jgi:peptidyl-prolyl cis-trans isomerase A (cyclophilin A)
MLKFKLIIAATLLASSSVAFATTEVTIQTNKGTMELELDEQKAPITVANFISYVKSGFYNQTIFHRVIPGFMIQGGGFTSSLQQKPVNAPIKNEADNGLRNLRGTIAMARTAEQDSATSQFFINVSDNAFLDHGQRDYYGYAVFGKVVKGLDVADKISQVATTSSGPYQNVPVKPIIIQSVTIKTNP